MARPHTAAAYAALLGVHMLAGGPAMPAAAQIVVASAAIVYIGAVMSLRRPVEEGADDAGNVAAPPGPMSEQQALRFPLTAAAMLGALFVAFKYFDKYYVNLLLGIYFFGIGALTLGDAVASQLEELVLRRRPKVLITMPILGDLTSTDIIGITCGCAISAWYLYTKHWLGNNLIAAAFCIHVIQSLSVGSFRVAAILLVGLFVYDIIAVFYTPMMVSVAKNVDGPIKMLFVREYLGGVPQFSMLGLGDIALPGLLVALIARFDQHRAGVGMDATTGWPEHNFSKPYLWSVLVGYTLGLIATLVVMYAFEHAQPALLYLVPAVLLTSLATAAFRGELQELFAYSEDIPDEDDLHLDSKERVDQGKSGADGRSDIMGSTDTRGGTDNVQSQKKESPQSNTDSLSTGSSPTEHVQTPSAPPSPSNDGVSRRSRRRQT